MIRFLLKEFIRSKSLFTGVATLLITGLVSIYIGGLFLEKQASTVSEAAQTQQEGLERTQHFVKDDDLGLFLYYVRFGLINQTPRLAGLAVGQRDVHPTAQAVNIRNLEEQRHVSILRNPSFQVLGNLDFGFVLTFLFPLVIIGFSFNLLSEEQEGGTWRVILAQTGNPAQVLYAKLGLRVGAVMTTLLLLLVTAKVYLDIPFDAHFVLFIGVTCAYIIFWFSLSWFVVRQGRSSSQNALSLLIAWISLLIVVPSALQAAVVKLYPTPEAYSAMLESRDGYHNKWDEPVGPTLAAFKEVYPQYADYQHPEGASFGWLWYYAMQHMGDVEAEPSTKALQLKLQQRDRFSRFAGYFVPSVHTHLTMGALSRSDLDNYLKYQAYLASFHEALRLRFYPNIFEEKNVSSIEWAAFKLQEFTDFRDPDWLSSLLPLLLASLCLIFLAKVVNAPLTAAPVDS